MRIDIEKFKLQLKYRYFNPSIILEILSRCEITENCKQCHYQNYLLNGVSEICNECCNGFSSKFKQKVVE